MPSETIIPIKYSPEQTRGGWQLRISIDPSALARESKESTESKEHTIVKPRKKSFSSKIETIKNILITELAGYDVHHVQLWKITDRVDYLEFYDGTTSHQGMDRTEQGKEIRIDFPDAAHCTFDAEQYKEMVLKLWKAFQDNDVLLEYMYIPGDKKILGPFHLATPFSFTSVHPSPLKIESKDLHGKLHKQFEPFEKNHPLLHVTITEQDLERHGIAFSPVKCSKNSRLHFYSRQKRAKLYLEHDLRSYLNTKEEGYASVLASDIMMDRILRMLSDHIKSIPADITQHSAYVETCHSVLMKDKEFRLLLHAYPRQGSQLKEHPSITTLRSLSPLDTDVLDVLIRCIQELRRHYAKNHKKILQEIQAHFRAHEPDTCSNSETMPIDWAAYIRNYSHQHLETLIRRNPAGMQILYRRIVLLEQDRKGHVASEHQYDEVIHSSNGGLSNCKFDESDIKKFLVTNNTNIQVATENKVTETKGEEKTALLKTYSRVEPLAQNIDFFITKWQAVLKEEKVSVSLNGLNQDLFSLHNDLSRDITQQLEKGKSSLIIEQSTAYKIASKTSSMLRDLDEILSHPIADDNWKRDKIHETIMTYQKKCTEMPFSKKFIKTLVIVVATILGFALGAFAGAGIGIAAGAWSGFGVAFTSTMGLVVGAAKGASAGLAIGASITGLASGIAAYSLFGRDPLKKKVGDDLDQIAASAEMLVPKIRA